MRKFILDHYPNAEQGYHAKVSKMKYKQVYAICKSLEERDARNAKLAVDAIKERKNEEQQPHQINIFEYMINKQAAEEKFLYEIKEEEDKIFDRQTSEENFPYEFKEENYQFFGLVGKRWMEFESEKEYSDYIKEERANI